MIRRKEICREQVDSGLPRLCHARGASALCAQRINANKDRVRGLEFPCCLCSPYRKRLRRERQAARASVKLERRNCRGRISKLTAPRSRTACVGETILLLLASPTLRETLFSRVQDNFFVYRIELGFYCGSYSLRC